MPFKDKEKEKEYNKQYYQKNKEKEKEYQKKYYQENKEKNKDKMKIYRQENKDKIKEQQKIYRQENKDKIKEKMKIYRQEYNQTDKGIKSKRISNWKTSGVVCDDYDKLYEMFINTTNCENCDILLTTDKVRTNTTKCLDHNHQTGLFRYILCNRCNIIFR